MESTLYPRPESMFINLMKYMKLLLLNAYKTHGESTKSFCNEEIGLIFLNSLSPEALFRIQGVLRFDYDVLKIWTEIFLAYNSSKIRLLTSNW